MNRVVVQEASESFQVEHTESLNMKPELIIKAMQTVISKQDEGAEQRIAGALAALNEAKDAHTASMGKLSDIEASIQRCEQERQTALSESAQAEQDWRSRFRRLLASYPLSARRYRAPFRPASKFGATGLSAALPPVSMNAKGRPITSVRTWILVV